MSLEKSEQITPDTFRLLSNCLLRNIADKNACVEALSSETSYLPIVALANNCWLTGALVASLKEMQLWSTLPEQLQAYLDCIDSTYRRHLTAVRQECEYICRLLSADNIEHVLLKGAAQLFNGAASPITTRYMVDVDILISPEQLAQAQALLKTHGYHEQADRFDVTPLKHHHCAPLIRDGGPCFVELHSEALKQSVDEVLSTDEVWRNCQKLNVSADVTSKQLTATHQVIMAIAHSELSDGNHHQNRVDLRQLFNVYQLIKHFENDIDWPEVVEGFSQAQQHTVLSTFVYQLRYFFALTTPITEKSNSEAEQFIQRGLNRYVKEQRQPPFILHAKALWASYDSQALLRIYGERGALPILRARALHFKRHLAMFWSKIVSAIR